MKAMARGPIYEKEYRHLFSGHETFPLRYGWLKKSFDAVAETEGNKENKIVFLGEDAIARFGVGKNMVASMRHWATATGMITETQGTQVICTTELGQKLFGLNGLDPYMEHPATLWLIHWQLAALPTKTTWFWAFNYFPAMIFERDHLVMGLGRLSKDRAWSRVANATIKNDVACFVRTYVAQRPSGHAGNDDALESPLTELGLIKAVGKRDNFRFVRGRKPTLGNGVFIHALLDFWSRYSSTATLSFEAIAHEPGGPGRVFLLDENDVADRLMELDDRTDGALRWSESAGLKQVVRDPSRKSAKTLSYIDQDYVGAAQRGTS
jgi:hypothetical protein